jgi:hypothetical protein
VSKGVKWTPAWESLRRTFGAAARSKPRVEVGVFSDRKHSGKRGGISMGELALVHEFGSLAANIPERSFLRRTFRRKEREIAAAAAKAARKVVSGKGTFNQALAEIGKFAAAEVKKTIKRGPYIPPPLKPETIRRKGSTRPLVDTGQLADAVTFKVRR